LAQVTSLARIGSLEGTGVDGESLERYRRATRGAVAGVVARVVSLLTMVVSIPLVLAELGSQHFGIWATLASFTVLLNFADLGIGNGLVNMLVRADREGDHRRAAEHVTSALALVTIAAVLLGILFASVYGVVDWAAFYNTGASGDAEVAASATAVFAGCFLVLLPLGLFQRIHLGYQEATMTYAWVAAGSVLGLMGVLAASLADASLPWFVAATTGGPVVAGLLNGIVLLGRSRPWLRPRPSMITMDSLRHLASTGGAFFVIQSSSAIAYYSGPIIVAQVKGAAAVEDYAVPMRLFAFLPVLLSIAMTAAWPALRSAVLEGDIGWARRMLKRATWLGLSLLALPTLGLVLFGDVALRLWTDDEVGASTLVLVSFGAWSLLSAIVWPLWTIMVATEALRVQATMSLLMAVASVALAVELTQSIGIAGVVIGVTLAQLVFFVLPSSLYTSRLLRRLERPKIPSI
jgi:O-antigen/teichoic acid export membrane protein